MHAVNLGGLAPAFPDAGPRGERGHLFDLTRDFVRRKSPCAEGFRWFLRHHPEGGGYQQVLDALVAAGRVGDACWLLDQFGPTSDVLELAEITAPVLVFAGSIKAQRGIEVTTLLRAGRSISAGGDIAAGGDIVAGEDLRAGGHVHCAGALSVGGDLHAGASVEVEGKLQGRGSLRAGGVVVVRSDVAVAGNVFAASDLLASAEVQCGKSLRVRGLLRSGGGISAADGIVAGGGIDCGHHLETRLGIRSGADIEARGAVRAGESVGAAGTIVAGAGFGVFAGLSVERDAWETSALVAASVRPDNLMSGHWAGGEP